MKRHNTVTPEQWLAQRRQLLEKEKEFTRLRDELSRQRRALPWVRIEKDYAFDTLAGRQTLEELFEGRSQLMVYHFMFGPHWQAGCKSCSFWADHFDGMIPHLNARDITLLAVSRASLAQIEGYRKRLGWRFKWVSSAGSDFNYDFYVSFHPEQIQAGQAFYNYRMDVPPADESPGLSVFYRHSPGQLFHTYSCYARGLDMLNGAYQFMDLAPKGRDEEDLPQTMAWLRRHDEYGR